MNGIRYHQTAAKIGEFDRGRPFRMCAFRDADKIQNALIIMFAKTIIDNGIYIVRRTGSKSAGMSGMYGITGLMDVWLSCSLIE
jgi:hypothetical protein